MEDNEPRRCTCELEAALKTVNKVRTADLRSHCVRVHEEKGVVLITRRLRPSLLQEGPNKGREFYVCPKESERAR